MCLCTHTHTHIHVCNHTHNYTQLDHAVMATKFTDTTGRSRLAASHRLLKGYLVNSEGETVRQLSSGKSDRVSYIWQRGKRERGERKIKRQRERERERERERRGGGPCPSNLSVELRTLRVHVYVWVLLDFLHWKSLLMRTIVIGNTLTFLSLNSHNVQPLYPPTPLWPILTDYYPRAIGGFWYREPRPGLWCHWWKREDVPPERLHTQGGHILSELVLNMDWNNVS